MSNAGLHDDRVRIAIDHCFDAVFLPDTWSQALHGLARALDAACTMFYPRNPDRESNDPRNPARSLADVPVSPEYTDCLDEYLTNHWYIDHYRAVRGMPLLDGGQSVVIEHDLATDEERATLRHYNELYLRFGFPGFAMIGFEAAGQSWAMPFLRGQIQGHFTPADADNLARLIPDVQRMIRLMEKVGGQWEAFGLALFDGLDVGAMLIDRHARVIGLNAAAEACLGPDLKLRAGRLSAADTQGDRRLQRFLTGVTSAEGSSLPEPISLPRSAMPPLRFDAMRLRGVTAEIFRRGHALLTVEPFIRRLSASPDMLRQAFRLTPAEARLAHQIGSGATITEAATALEITRETARSVLKVVFSKTDTHRQSELVALLEQAKSRIGQKP